MLQEIIDTFEELKKYVFIIDRGTKGKIIIIFRDEHFYHLVGLHKINFDTFLPNYIKTREKQYKYIKKNIDKYNNILQNQIIKKNTLQNRIKTFSNILDLLKGNNIALFDLKKKIPGSLYDGDYGILKIYQEMYCLLGLKKFAKIDCEIYCAPQSWMANNREIKLTKNKIPLYVREISIVYKENFISEYNYSK